MSGGHRFHPTILREYDVRGIVGETLFPEDARALGRAFATILRARGGRRLCVGRDGRLSSPELHRALVEGLCAGGVDVLDLGLGPTPMMYFAVHELDTDGGIQVTGSHNPPSHNGFKLMLGKASFFGEQIRELGRLAASGDFSEGAGGVERVDVFDRYVARLARDYHGTRPLDVVWDAGNGAAGPAMAALAARLPGRHHCLFAEVDGRFPNHHPDPTEPHNLEALIAAVRARGAELGIAFDGDGDRIGVVDGKGRILWGDQLLMILAEDLLARQPGATIIADVKASQVLFDTIAALGGRPLMWKTGHSLIKSKMVETGAPLAGEMSGHIFYKDGFYGHDDALYVAVRLLDILGRGSRTLAEIRDAMPRTFSTPEVRFPCPEERKFAVVADLARSLAAEGAEVDTTDGVRVCTGDGWWLLRASNTQAVLVARAEARTPEGLERLRAELRQRLRALGIEPPSSF
ncbi:MAG: phosphomannomutase/phosphoglucomutase [Geminicoccaceae bacterium]|nr:phosphomannomutase/phosphoglucomutase [Geminicoccaceae bacterium]MCS7269001.1 phosphomannomutase/phosphoglucomutase [Geminicoccaceae bacterium]MCX7629662.1 phosphomannomutase/phosphoglucomutase [Geminicoccaceae bacterium]MDW8123460.1 phosphomannomutase/phosphoglucomutase [Geminicoccaceae bacterium]MDW8342150.1 phosphomannomutase/phosphoglucomutase [Geminicoccaceae bacterium]